MLMKDLRGKSKKELAELLMLAKKEMMGLRFKKAAMEKINPAAFRGLRLRIARIKTVMGELSV